MNIINVIFHNIIIDIQERTTADSNVSNITDSTNIPINNPTHTIYCIFFLYINTFFYVFIKI